MFKEEREDLKFDWSMIGNIGEERPNPGSTMDVSVLFSEYTGKDFSAREVDCWCSGDRFCRFEAKSAF